MPGWGVVRTQVLQEDKARRHLVDQGYEVFVPSFKTYVISRGKRQLRTQKLFPGYLFVYILEAFYAITGTRGVSYLIMDGDRPALVKAAEINYLRQRFDETGTHALTDGRFSAGQLVRALSGPFADQTGMFETMRPGDRVNVLFEMMGRTVRAELGERELAVA